jgi:hypothetical protein
MHYKFNLVIVHNALPHRQQPAEPYAYASPRFA